MFLSARNYSLRILKRTHRRSANSPFSHILIDASPFYIKRTMDSTATASNSFTNAADMTSNSSQISQSAGSKGKAKAKVDGKSQNPSNSKKNKNATKPSPSQNTKLRGMDRDSPDVRISKTISWLLRHGAQSEGLVIRQDGYVKVSDLLGHPKLNPTGLGLEGLKVIVQADSKQRYDLVLENSAGATLDSVLVGPVALPALDVGAKSVAPSSSASPNEGTWWIKARQGHSMKAVQLEMKPIKSLSDIPTGVAVHGTNKMAWEIISRAGLSKMKRNHIHLAQDVAGQNVVSGMRTSSQVLVYINVQKALDSGINFWLSDNGVVLTEGDETGYLSKRFFHKVTDAQGADLHGWEES